MKLSKILTISAMATIIAFNAPLAQAESCDGGRTITGANGHEYCRSQYGMNWWSGYTWCAANGRHLASISEICPGWGGTLYQSCGGNLAGMTVWTSTAYGTEKAIYLTSSDGNAVITDNRNSVKEVICY